MVFEKFSVILTVAPVVGEVFFSSFYVICLLLSVVVICVGILFYYYCYYCYYWHLFCLMFSEHAESELPGFVGFCITLSWGNFIVIIVSDISPVPSSFLFLVVLFHGCYSFCSCSTILGYFVLFVFIFFLFAFQCIVTELFFVMRILCRFFKIAWRFLPQPCSGY